MKKTIFKTIMLLSALFSVLSVNASTTENRQHKIAKYFGMAIEDVFVFEEE